MAVPVPRFSVPPVVELPDVIVTGLITVEPVAFCDVTEVVVMTALAVPEPTFNEPAVVELPTAIEADVIVAVVIEFCREI